MSWRGFIIGCLLVGCDSSSGLSVCKVACEIDSDCPTDQTCGLVGLCTDGVTSCPCEPDKFLRCDQQQALSCNAEGTEVAIESCNNGCNAEFGRCNACVPDSQTCFTDVIATCSTAGDGYTQSSCALGCVDATETEAPRCKYISPAFLPDVCDVVAAEEELVLPSSVNLDTRLDTLCNGGIVTPTLGPPICVVRYRRIELSSGSVRVTGPRVLALVADEELSVAATLDASAGGPGAGTLVSGARALSSSGGGGAGFRTNGGGGGGNTTVGTGGVGGVMLMPDPTTTGMIGGPQSQGPTSAQLTQGYPLPGSAGGAVLLIACRGSATITGTVDVNGGGGAGGKGILVQGNSVDVGGTGGGAGGVAIVQGATVVVSGSMFANGGGGGGGCGGSGCVGGLGQTGQRSTTPGTGGPAAAGGGDGGTGGTGTVAPGPGAGKGGGGGAAGWLWAYTPEGAAPTLSSTSSPAIEARTLTVR